MASPNRRAHHASAHVGSASTHGAASQANADLFRSLVWDGYVNLSVCIASSDLTAGSDRSTNTLYIRPPRISYLSLLIPEIRRTLLEIVLDENALAVLRPEQIWFDCEGEPLKWHWPIGLIHDYLRANNVQLSTSSDPPKSYFPPVASSSLTRADPQFSQPLRITIHLSNPPSDKLLSSNSIDACRASFMNLVKEADVVRWGSVKRVTALRKVDQDALWEGVVAHDYDKYWAVASKLVPSPGTRTASRVTSPPMTTVSSLDAGMQLPDAANQRSIPIRVYLPHGGPVVQDIVPAVHADGVQTLQSALSSMVPALFGSIPVGQDMTASFIASRKKLVKRVIVQGIDLPLDAELPWCSTCLCYPDGWLSVVLAF